MNASILMLTNVLCVGVRGAPAQAPPGVPTARPTADTAPAASVPGAGSDAAASAAAGSNSEAIAPVELTPVAVTEPPTEISVMGAGDPAQSSNSGGQVAGTSGMASEPSSVPAQTVEMAATQVVQEEVVSREIKWRFDLGVGGGSYSPLDKSYGVFSGGMASVGRLDIDAGLSFPIGQSGLYLGGRLGYRMFEGEEYGVHGLSLPTYTQQEINLGARLGFAILDAVEPYVELAGGPTLWRGSSDEETVGLGGAEDSFGGGDSLVGLTLQDRTLGFVKGVAGVQLYLPRKWLPRKEGSRVTAGIDLNVGYVWRPSFDLTLVDQEPTEGAIATTLPTFGSVNASAVMWSAGLFLRVM